MARVRSIERRQRQPLFESSLEHLCGSSVAAKLGHTEMLMWGLLAGLVLGFGTDFILVAAGA